MSNTVGELKVVSQVYSDFPDDISTLYGTGFDKCGERSHYLTSSTSSTDSRTLPDMIYRVIEYLNFKTNSASTVPKTYRFDVQTTNYASIGLHNLVLNVALKDYPTATVAKVPFIVNVNPCIVTSYQPPADYKWDYVVGNKFANYIFNFMQTPCSYSQKFSATLANGNALPKFMTVSPTDGYFRVYATNQTDVGNYEVEVTGQLNNLELFGSSTSNIDPALKINPLNPPSSFIYKSSFKIFLNVAAAPPSYSAPNNTAPFLIPTPSDLWFYASDRFVKDFGPAYDNENNKVTVTTDFGNAARFIFWDPLSNTMTIPANATNTNDLGEYPLKLTLNDGVTTTVAYGNSSWVGNVTYQFKLTIFRKPLVATTVQKPPDVRIAEVFTKYNTSVIDVRSFDKQTIFNATDTSVVKVAKPQLADATVKVVQAAKDETKTGETNSTQP